MSEMEKAGAETEVIMQEISPDSAVGSINSESCEVEIRPATIPSGGQLRLTLDDMEKTRQKSNAMDKDRYFALKEGYFEKAEKCCKSELYYPDIDGAYVGAWLVTEIDHWDNEKERLVMLTQKQLIIVRFNFVTLKIETFRKIPLVNCTRIQSGNLTYSSSTFQFYRSVTHRLNQTGVRVHWNPAKIPGSLDFWNPWSSDIPFVTFIPHISVEVNDNPPEFCDFDAFQKSLTASAASDISRALLTDQEPIVIHIILGLSAVVHNQSKLGFSRDRGGISY